MKEPACIATTNEAGNHHLGIGKQHEFPCVDYCDNCGDGVAGRPEDMGRVGVQIAAFVALALAPTQQSLCRSTTQPSGMSRKAARNVVTYDYRSI